MWQNVEHLKSCIAAELVAPVAPRLTGGIGGDSGAGLVNEHGLNNCFLNVIVQCLWHYDAFRAGAVAMDLDFCRGALVVHALLLLLRELGTPEAQDADR